MKAISHERSEDLISQIEIARVELEAAFPLAAQLLAMAVLQVRLQQNRITDSEFKEFCEMIENRLLSPNMLRATSRRPKADLADRPGLSFQGSLRPKIVPFRQSQKRRS